MRVIAYHSAFPKPPLDAMIGWRPQWRNPGAGDFQRLQAGITEEGYPYIVESTMKILLKVVGAIVACVILALVVLSITGLDPNGHRAGLWLKGDVTACPVNWGFAAKYPTLMIETHTWYLIPHSVNIYFVTDNDNLYLHADYPPGGKFPGGKSWTANVARDPNLRIKIGDQLFDCKAVLLDDPAEFATLFENFRKKYPRSPFSNYRRRGDVYFLRVLPR
jgi:hypothetical protein